MKTVEGQDQSRLDYRHSPKHSICSVLTLYRTQETILAVFAEDSIYDGIAWITGI